MAGHATALGICSNAPGLIDISCLGHFAGGITRDQVIEITHYAPPHR